MKSSSLLVVLLASVCSEAYAASVLVLNKEDATLAIFRSRNRHAVRRTSRIGTTVA